MMPTALSQVAEAFGKLLFGLLLASLALRRGSGTEETAAFAVLGLTLGMAFAALLLMLRRRMEGRAHSIDCEERESHLLRGLLRVAIPVTLSSAVVSLTKVIDMTMILRRLGDGGLVGEDAFALYGNYTTLALPLFALAPTLVTSVAMPLIPTLSRAVAEKNLHGQYEAVREAMKLTAWVAMPISLGLTLFAKPILSLLFSGAERAIAQTAPLLALLGPSVVLSCLITVSNAVLQAYGEARIPILSLTAGSALKLTLAYFLIGNAKIGMLGAPISTFFCDLLAVTVNFYWIEKRMDRTPSVWDTLCRPFAAALLSVTSARYAYHLLCRQSGGAW
jgi:stage V sporulation protein B